jgi:hypothetical protein
MSEAFIKYMAYMVLLIHEQQCGRDEGENTRADQIRDEMDPYWYQMTEEEMKLVDQISETVYVIEETADNLLP